MKTKTASVIATWALSAIIAAAAQLPTPRPLSPPDGATGVSTNALLKCREIDGAVGYRFRVKQGSRTIGQQTTSGPSATFSLGYGMTVGWDVTALARHAVDNSDPSKSSGFATAPAPLIPQLLVPGNGSTVDSSTELFLRWLPMHNIRLFEFQYSLAPLTDSTPVVVTGETFMGLFTEPGQKYNWRVRAKRPNGQLEPWSETWQFVTDLKGLVQVALTYPASGSAGVEPTTYLGWNPVKAGYYEYEAYEGPVIDLGRLLATGFVTGDGSTVPTFVDHLPFKPAATYTWRVRAFIGSQAGPWSNPFTFSTTANPSPLAHITAPKNGQNDVVLFHGSSEGGPASGDPYRPGRVYVKCSEVYQADLYTFQVYEGPLLDPARLKTETSASSPTAEIILDSLHQYTVRAMAVRQGGIRGPWSDPVMFTTIRGTVTLRGATEAIKGQVHFSWDPRNQALAYEFKLAGPAARDTVDRVVAASELTLSLRPAVTYSWSVRPLGMDNVIGDWASGKYQTKP